MKILAALAAAALLATATAQAQQRPLPEIRLSAGMHLIRAEVADTFGSRMQGLMYRRSLAPNGGMLFVYEQADIHCMWMKNTLIPLSVAFLDEHGAIINIADMQPHSEQSHCAARPASFALEMSRGWFEERGIGPGARLRGLPAK